MQIFCRVKPNFNSQYNNTHTTKVRLKKNIIIFSYAYKFNVEIVGEWKLFLLSATT